MPPVYTSASRDPSSRSFGGGGGFVQLFGLASPIREAESKLTVHAKVDWLPCFIYSSYWLALPPRATCQHLEAAPRLDYYMIYGSSCSLAIQYPTQLLLISALSIGENSEIKH